MLLKKKIITGILIVALLLSLSLMLSSIFAKDNFDINTFPAINIEMNYELHRIEWRRASVSITGANWRYNFGETNVMIRGRGQSSWNVGEKLPFRIRFNEPRPMLGSTHIARHWTFISNHFDFSLMRNYSAYYLASLLEGMSVAPFARFVDVYINGEYYGVFMMSIQVSEIVEGRVELTYHPNPALSEYLIELNGHALNRANRYDEIVVVHRRAYEIRFPSDNMLTEAHISYVEGYLNRIYELAFALDDNIFNYIHLPSFVDFYIVQELFKNLDVGMNSVFMQIRGNRGERRIEMGPVWDFDGSSGGSTFNSENIPYGHLPYGIWAGLSNRWFRYLMQMPTFNSAVTYRWNEIRDVQIRQMLEHIDYTAVRSQSAFERNFERWPIIGTCTPWPMGFSAFMPPEYLEITDFQGYVDYLIDFLERRIVWLDAHFNNH